MVFLVSLILCMVLLSRFDLSSYLAHHNEAHNHHVLYAFKKSEATSFSTDTIKIHACTNSYDVNHAEVKS